MTTVIEITTGGEPQLVDLAGLVAGMALTIRQVREVVREHAPERISLLADARYLLEIAERVSAASDVGGRRGCPWLRTQRVARLRERYLRALRRPPVGG
jgi:hypothetical protein